MLPCREGSEQSQRLHLTSVRCWSVGLLVPWKEKHCPHFQGNHFQWTSPEPILPAMFSKLFSAKSQSAMQTKLPSQVLMQPRHRGRALSNREGWQLLNFTWARDLLIMGWTTGLKEAQRDASPARHRVQKKTQFTRYLYHQGGESVSEKVTTSNYVHTDISFWTQITVNLGLLNAFHQLPLSQFNKWNHKLCNRQQLHLFAIRIHLSVLYL